MFTPHMCAVPIARTLDANRKLVQGRTEKGWGGEGVRWINRQKEEDELSKDRIDR